MPSGASIDRSTAPTRRKSCLGCAKSRRRCDQVRPTCQRCSQRNVSCQYPDGANAESQPYASEEQVGLGLVPQFDLADSPHISCLGMLDSILEPTDSVTSQLFQTSPQIDNPTPLLGIDLSRPSARLTTTAQDALDRCRSVTLPQLSKVVASRFQYAIEKISTAPYQMVMENQMPWCHTHLYDDGMPRSMQHAVSSAALHVAKNNINARVIRDNIESRVQDLLSSPAATTPLEKLAYAQALFIYQTLRLLDIDARVRYNYEATMAHLEEAAYALIPHISFHESPSLNQPNMAPELLSLYPVSAARDFWTTWIFQESARRTLGIIIFFILTHRYMTGDKGNYCSRNKTISRSVTMSAQLWNSRNPVDFALAWRNKKHFVVHADALDNLASVIDDAKSDDIDDFGKISLSAVMGLDEARAWLAIRGATL